MANNERCHTECMAADYPSHGINDIYLTTLPDSGISKQHPWLSMRHTIRHYIDNVMASVAVHGKDFILPWHQQYSIQPCRTSYFQAAPMADIERCYGQCMAAGYPSHGIHNIYLTTLLDSGIPKQHPWLITRHSQPRRGIAIFHLTPARFWRRHFGASMAKIGGCHVYPRSMCV